MTTALVDLQPEALLEEAARRTGGLTDLGPGPYVEPMRRFVTGMAKERFTPAGGAVTLSGLYVETEDRTGRATRAVPVRLGGALAPSAPV